jgi:hypothetical protein
MLIPHPCLDFYSAGLDPRDALFLGQFNIEMMELTPLRYFCKDLRLP